MEPILMACRQCQIFWRTILLLGLLTLFTINPPTTLLAQNHARGIKFERIGLEQGLSQSTVYCILQDQQGFMWFGSLGKLNNNGSYRQNILFLSRF